jgi:DNA-binding response OmpR family regulator
MKILLIDERSDTLNFLCENLVNFGYKTGIAKNKVEIISMLSDDQYNVIVTNDCARELDVDQSIRSEYPLVFAVFLSASDKKEKTENHGVDLYLYRPLEVHKLLSYL